jgi:hypothetical protein
MSNKNAKKEYFVDEAGDGNLFNKKGNIIIGQEGCSRYFLLGVLDVKDPNSLSTDFLALREQLLNDPYFKNVPSMQKESRKTYYSFHAKDDLPEVRREVFSLIRTHDLSFLAVVRDKKKVLQYVNQRNQNFPDYHYHPNELYDFMVRVLFKNLLHKNSEYEITFSKRGKQDRTNSLKEALEKARKRYEDQWQKTNHSIINVLPDIPSNAIPLQIVDYFLWSLQRFYERKEDRFLELLWPQFKMVHDLDDTRKARYGCFYDKKRPLTRAAFDDNLPGI